MTFSYHHKTCCSTWMETVSISVSWQPVLRMETDVCYGKSLEECLEIRGSFSGPSATFWTLKECFLWHCWCCLLLSPSFFSERQNQFRDKKKKTFTYNHCICTHFPPKNVIDWWLTLVFISCHHSFIYQKWSPVFTCHTVQLRSFFMLNNITFTFTLKHLHILAEIVKFKKRDHMKLFIIR